MVRMATDRALLSRGLESLSLDLPETAVNRLLAYRDLLAKWNQAYNLTAVRDPREMIGRHLIDSLAALAHLPEGRLLAMGAGAGLPGVLSSAKVVEAVVPPAADFVTGRTLAG